MIKEGLWSPILLSIISLAMLHYLVDRPMSVVAEQMLAENHESYGIGTDPVDWLDTGMSSSLTEEESVFTVFFPIVNNLLPHTLTLNIQGNGSVSSNPDKVQFIYGEEVTLTATADPDWVFAGWSGDLEGNINPETLTMNGDKVVTATFTEITYTLAVSTVGDGTVTLNPDKAQYSDGEMVTLTATADPGWVLSGWSGDLTGSTNPETLNMDVDKTVVATFEIDPDPSLPIIDVWYGTEQQFGQVGIPQQWVNILGNVTDPDGIDTLTYSLNGGSESALSIGPDTCRLADEGT